MTSLSSADYPAITTGLRGVVVAIDDDSEATKATVPFTTPSYRRDPGRRRG